MFAYVDTILIFTPLLSFMLYDFMQDEMIFNKYGKWLNTINPTLAKPLGKCLKCFHVWIFIIISLIVGVDFFKFITTLPLTYLILIKFFYS
jgi:hypothetical protein